MQSAIQRLPDPQTVEVLSTLLQYIRQLSETLFQDIKETRELIEKPRKQPPTWLLQASSSSAQTGRHRRKLGEAEQVKTTTPVKDDPVSNASGIAGKGSALTRTLARVKADGKFLILRVYRFVTQKPCKGEVCFGQVRFLARTPGVDLGLEESRGWPGVTFLLPFGLAQASEGWGSKSQGPNTFRVAVISICEFPILLGRSEPWWSWEAAGDPPARWVKKSEAVEPVPRPKGSEVPRWRWRAVPEAQREEAKSDLKKWSEGHSGTSRPASVRRGHDTWQAPREDSRVPAVWRKKSAPPVGQGESVPRRPLDKEAWPPPASAAQLAAGRPWVLVRVGG
ncbi:unnamed protein product [Effrenium voratum]|nr:unnamed protein product [Effrenium voratum]